MSNVSDNEIALRIAQFIEDRLGISLDDIDFDENLGSYGLSSMLAVQVIGTLEEWLGIRLAPALVYQHPTINELASAIHARCTGPERDRLSSCYRTVSNLSVIEALALRSEVHADRVLFRFLDEQGEEKDSVTYAELWRRVRILANRHSSA